jgi:hypothetical protein
MSTLRFLIAALFLSANGALAQSQGEITFWETVRDSKNPAEVQAYLDQYPTGTFAVLAKARLAALQRPAPAVPTTARPAPAVKSAPAAVASFAPSTVTSEARMPQPGDTWAYQLSYPRMRGQWGQGTRQPSTLTVKVDQVGGDKIIDHLSIDGGTPSESTHSTGNYLAPQGAPVFSPYLVAFRDLPLRGSLGSVTILEPGCSGRYACEASARVFGQESVQVPAGTFTAVKVVVSHEWRSSGSNSGGAAIAGLMGGRALTVWYVPELKRAVKMQSRVTVGETPPVEANFDLELTSYQIK